MMNVQDAAIQILKDAGKPLHAKEIAERIIQAGLWVAKGKTPEATVSARLYSDIKKLGDQSTFVKVAPQTFSLRDVQLVAVCDVKDPESKNEGSSTSTKATYSFLDAAEKVLDQFGNRNSTHYRDITDKAMNQGWLNTSGKTPEATMNAQLMTELKRAKASGEPGRFVRTSPFADGNGRMGRLWQSLILGQLHEAFLALPVESMVHDNQQVYYDVINESTKRADCGAFIEFMLTEIHEALKLYQREEQLNGAVIGAVIGAVKQVLDFVQN